MTSQSLFILPLILLLLGICGPANEAVQPAGQPLPNDSVQPQQPTNATQTDLDTWNDINKGSVESACLQEAKAEAGSMAWAVRGCDCSETLGAGVKEYGCGISTLQGTISARIKCVLENRTCLLESGYGNGSMTFEEIRRLQGGK